MPSTLTRRQLLAGLSAFAASARAYGQFRFFQQQPPAPAPLPLVYFGTDTDKGVSKGIYAARFDPATGYIGAPFLASASFRPAFFALGSDHNKPRLLYVGNEGAGPTSTVTSYAMDAATGSLSKQAAVSAAADGPCYVAVDVTGQALFIADYMGSTVASYKVLLDGTLSPAVSVLPFNNHARFGPLGPQHDRQDASHPHCATISPDNRFVVVCDLGTDRIWTIPFQPESAKLGTPMFFQTKPGSGPRHVAFHPNNRWVYGICELANRIDQYLWTATHAGSDSQALLVDTNHSVSTLAPHYAGPTNTAAEIAISADGQYLYASNRGEETLVVFMIDQQTGALKHLQRIPCGGKGPRHFTFDPSGKWLLCGNQLSANVTVFSRDEAGGKLAGPVQTLPLDSVMFTLFA